MNFDEIYKENKKIGQTQYRNYFQALQYHDLFNLLNKYKNDSDNNLLDWGGAQGHCSVMSAMLGYKSRIFSLLYYPDKWNVLKSHGIEVDFDPEAVKTLPYKDYEFSHVLSCGVLEHVRETGGTEEASINELTRVLQPNGILTVYHLPNTYSWIEFISRNFRKTYYHPFRYTKKDVMQMKKFSSKKCEILETGLYNLIPRRIFHRLKGKKIGIFLHKLDKLLCLTPLKYLAQCRYFILKVE